MRVSYMQLGQSIPTLAPGVDLDRWSALGVEVLRLKVGEYSLQILALLFHVEHESGRISRCITAFLRIRRGNKVAPGQFFEENIAGWAFDAGFLCDLENRCRTQFQSGQIDFGLFFSETGGLEGREEIHS